MHLKSVYISQYKNLKDFTINFDSNSFIDVFVGKNGTGKSNFFEALLEIFRHLYEYDKDKNELDFNYSISFVSDDKETEIAWTSGEFKINGRKRKIISKIPLPENVLSYYSGHNDTVLRKIKPI
jgi:recombinational DNA repair ATPase RecF